MAQGNQDFSFRVFYYAYGDVEWLHFLVNAGAFETAFLRRSVGTIKKRLTSSGVAIHGAWIPAIPAGMTYFKMLVYIDEHRGMGTIKPFT
jgi:hypothetical protein